MAQIRDWSEYDLTEPHFEYLNPFDGMDITIGGEA